jgi:hypothetical protein
MLLNANNMIVHDNSQFLKLKSSPIVVLLSLFYAEQYNEKIYKSDIGNGYFAEFCAMQQ